VPTFQIEIDKELTRKQRKGIQRAAFRWRMQLSPRKAEPGPWKQDWGILYECPAASEAEARSQVVEALGADLGDHLIIRPV
jgi:hypothetical protein